MAQPAPPKPPLAAVDTNVLLDLADGNERAWGAVETLRRRLKGGQIVVLPTVVQELVHLAEHGATERARRAARRLVAEWKFVPLNFIPAGHGITERIADSLRARGLLPDEEVNDAFIVAESALAGCTLLLSSDRHILEIPAVRLNPLLADAHVTAPLIASPRDIVRKFGG
jgi:predicted nucleic acid-binding protein